MRGFQRGGVPHPAGPLVLYAGRIAPEKGIPLLAEAFSLVHAQRPDARLCVVGDWQRYSHIIDAKTGRPITHTLASATVIAPTPLEANGWDISMMVLGAEKAIALAKEQGLAIYLISKNGNGYSTYMSPQFKQFLAQQ